MSDYVLQTPEARQALLAAADEYERAAREADLAAQHLRDVARHFRERDVPVAALTRSRPTAIC